MSQYTNRMGINMAEATTLTFNHEMNINGEVITTTVAQVTMHHECLKDMHRVIGETLKIYEEQSKPISSARKGMN